MYKRLINGSTGRGLLLTVGCDVIILYGVGFICLSDKNT